MKNDIKLTIEPVRQMGSFVSGRGEAYSTKSVIYHQRDQQSVVMQVDEYNKRPFYDAWEYRGIKQVQLFQTDQILWVVVKIEEDVEWGIGSTATHEYRKSLDFGKTWQECNGHEWVNIAPGATLVLTI